MRIEINAAGAQIIVDSGDGPIEPDRFDRLRDTALDLWREGVARYEARLATDREHDDARPPTIGPTGQLAGGERRTTVLDPLSGGWAYQTVARAPLGFELPS